MLGTRPGLVYPPLTLLTLPISEVHETTMVLGTVVDSRMREVIFMGRLGLFGSTPFFVGGRYPCSQNKKQNQKYLTLFLCNSWCEMHEQLEFETNKNQVGLTGRLQGLPLTFTHRLGGK